MYVQFSITFRLSNKCFFSSSTSANPGICVPVECHPNDPGCDCSKSDQSSNSQLSSTDNCHCKSSFFPMLDYSSMKYFCAPVKTGPDLDSNSRYSCPAGRPNTGKLLHLIPSSTFPVKGLSSLCITFTIPLKQFTLR